jgi:hypothetical protein
LPLVGKGLVGEGEAGDHDGCGRATTAHDETLELVGQAQVQAREPFLAMIRDLEPESSSESAF